MNKYRAKKTEAFGITFDSAKEARRYGDLVLLQRAGEIKNLERQVEFSIDIHGQHVCKYRADFQYMEKMSGLEGGWRTVIEDAKGYATPLYKLKKKLVHAIYGYAIRET